MKKKEETLTQVTSTEFCRNGHSNNNCILSTFFLLKFRSLFSQDPEPENPFIWKIINRNEFGFHEPI